VIGTSRHPDRIPADARLDGVTYRALDLRDMQSIDGFVTALANEGHHVDIVVNNAGESQSGPLEDLPLGALERLFHINVLGPVHLTQLLLPGMRERGYGRVVMVGSMLASFPLAYRSSYVASKAAIKGFATAARFEMAPFGVWLTTVEPGSIRTGISERRTKYIADDSPHLKPFRKMLRILDGNEQEGISAGRVARTILEAIEADPPAPLYAVGSNAPAVFALRRILPRSAVERVVARTYGVSPRTRPPS
jgi:short-subunit dehydrogenase